MAEWTIVNILGLKRDSCYSLANRLILYTYDYCSENQENGRWCRRDLKPLSLDHCFYNRLRIISVLLILITIVRNIFISKLAQKLSPWCSKAWKYNKFAFSRRPSTCGPKVQQTLATLDQKSTTKPCHFVGLVLHSVVRHLKLFRWWALSITINWYKSLVNMHIAVKALSGHQQSSFTFTRTISVPLENWLCVFMSEKMEWTQNSTDERNFNKNLLILLEKTLINQLLLIVAWHTWKRSTVPYKDILETISNKKKSSTSKKVEDMYLNRLSRVFSCYIMYTCGICMMLSTCLAIKQTLEPRWFFKFGDQHFYLSLRQSGYSWTIYSS